MYHIVFYEHMNDGTDVACDGSYVLEPEEGFRSFKQADTEARKACANVNRGLGDSILCYRIAKDAA